MVKLFSRITVHFAFPLMYQSSSFSHIYLNTWYWVIFSCIYLPFTNPMFFIKCLFFRPFFLCFIVVFWETRLLLKSFCQIYDYKYFLHVYTLSFPSLKSLFSYSISFFYFNKVQWIFFCLCVRVCTRVNI